MDMASGSSSSSCLCSFCLRPFTITAAGLTRTHGPVNDRCPGSSQLPGVRAPVLASAVPTSSPRASVPCPSSQGEPPSSPFILKPVPKIKILKRIPRASREPVKLKLVTILESVVSNNSPDSWERLLHFSGRCLRVPPRGGRRWSLATMVNKQLREESDPPPTRPRARKSRNTSQDSMESLRRRVSSKLEDGDFKGAVRLACSEDTLAESSETTLSALKLKHPSPPSESTIPPPPIITPLSSMSISEADIAQAIKSFPNGSAGGPDGMRPQHLKDLIRGNDITDSSLLTALAAFSTLVLEGRTPLPIRPFFFGASLTALNKKDGGIRPIAVGCTLRRLVAKIAGKMVVEDMAKLLAPRQLGYGVLGGAEAAVHAARQYITNIQPQDAVVKLDFRNAFNSVRRDKMLEAVQTFAPDIYPFVHSTYSSPSSLLWENSSIQSSEGVQQGDPLGPLLFCLAIHCRSIQLSSEFCVMYLDDITLGGSPEAILHDLEVIQSFEGIGLYLNNQKSEIISGDPVTIGTIMEDLPGARVVDPSEACLLGSPIGNENSVSTTLQMKVNSLTIMGARLEHFSAHDAMLLLRNSFAIPKLLYLLRTSPCFQSPIIMSYDESLKSIVSSVTNIQFTADDPAWTQATLPIRLGGLGIRSAVQLAPSAFLASAAASLNLIKIIVPSRLQSFPIPHQDMALSIWSQGHDNPPPLGTAACIQKNWDASKVMKTADSLLENACDDVTRARLLAVSAKESGAWLHALPISSVGLRMDDNTVRVAVGLRLGSTLGRPHICVHCGAEVDHLATHGLSCKKSEGRHHRHAAINDILHRALSSAKIPSRLEPSGLLRSDGKRPDGVTMVPWKQGKLLVWDATCPDTLAPSYRGIASIRSGAVAAAAEERKEAKYMGLDQCNLFTPIAIETLGVIGPKSLAFIKDLGRRVMQTTGEPKAHTYLLQQLSVAIQRGNAASVLGSFAT